MDLKVQHGEIVSFDSSTSRGRVFLQGGTQVEFHSTCFQSTLPTRFPKSGEIVKVTFDQGRLISVRSSK